MAALPVPQIHVVRLQSVHDNYTTKKYDAYGHTHTHTHRCSQLHQSKLVHASAE